MLIQDMNTDHENDFQGPEKATQVEQLMKDTPLIVSEDECVQAMKESNWDAELASDLLESRYKFLSRALHFSYK